MSVLKALRRVRPKELIKLAWLALTRPLFSFPTLSATRETIRVCDELFGSRHKINGPANAFRHAYWNILIARRCSRWSSDLDDLVSWAKKVTDWHENTFPNPVSARIMDLHNNRVGRDLYRAQPGLSEQEYIELLLRMKDEAIRLPELYIPERCKDCLVYLQKP